MSRIPTRRNVPQMVPKEPSPDPYVKLARRVVIRAIKDAVRGDDGALAFLFLSEEGHRELRDHWFAQGALKRPAEMPTMESIRAMLAAIESEDDDE